MKKTVAGLVLFLVLVAAAGAQSMKVGYLDGRAQVKNGASWTDLVAGDTVAADATIKVADGSIVQLTASGVEVTVARPGTYAVKDLVAARRSSAPSLGAALVGALRRLLGGNGDTQSTVLGTRGADQAGDSGDEWVENGSDIYRDQGIGSLKNGDLDGALRQFRTALGEASDSDTAEIHFYIGSTLAQKGDTPGAWKEIKGLQPPASEEWTPDFVLLKAQLLESMSSFTEATDWLVAHDLSRDAQRAQVYFYLLGVGYQGSGKADKARDALGRAASIAPDSELGKAASQLRGS